MDKTNTTAKYTYARGRRKTSSATVRIFEGKEMITFNGKPLDEIYPRKVDQEKVMKPLKSVGKDKNMFFHAKATGGGSNAQIAAVQHALARALVKLDESFRPVLKPLGFLTRDPRMVERKKTGLKKARKAPQFSKR